MVLAVAGATWWSGRPSVAAETPSTKDPWALVAEAQMRLESTEIAEGLQLFRRALTLDPGNQELIEEYGLSLADVGLAEQAVEQLRNCSQLSPAGEATLGIILAQSAQDTAQLDQAALHLQKGLDAAAQGSQDRLTLVQVLVRLDRGADAWTALQPLLADRPDDPRVQLLAGQALRLTGKFSEAEQYFRQAQNDRDSRQRATIELVETLAAEGKYKEAAELLGNFLQKEGATLTGLSRWATLLARSGDRAKAKSVLDDVLAKDPNFRDALLLKALLEAGDGHTESAEQLYRRALALNPSDPDAEIGLARTLMDVRRLDEARKLLDTLWEQEDKATPRDADALIQVAQERSALELEDRKPDAAKPWLQRLVGPPLERRSLALWAEYFRQREAFAEGIAWIEKARLADGQGVKRLAASVLGEFRLATGDTKGGIATLTPLFAGGSDDVLAGLSALERRKDYKQVVARAREALARLGNAPDVEFSLAAGLERSGAWDDAVTTFRDLIKRAPDNAAALNYLGYMFADKDVKLNEALELVNKAVELEPTSGAYLDSLGWVYFRLGNLDLAEKNLSHAVRLEPFDATVQEHLGDLYKARGERQRAEAAYRKALACNPDEAGQKERIEEKLASFAGHAGP